MVKPVLEEGLGKFPDISMIESQSDSDNQQN